MVKSTPRKLDYDEIKRLNSEGNNDVEISEKLDYNLNSVASARRRMNLKPAKHRRKYTHTGPRPKLWKFDKHEKIFTAISAGPKKTKELATELKLNKNDVTKTCKELEDAKIICSITLCSGNTIQGSSASSLTYFKEGAVSCHKKVFYLPGDNRIVGLVADLVRDDFPLAHPYLWHLRRVLNGIAGKDLTNAAIAELMRRRTGAK